ncbi:hypothetical protein Desor_3414 [Desulfosporosinus orientis DSM 765]|uniref:Uncharacterized protein n=1 Tax=Desulfosporosinus orientis (strain ATCC 19365 / DSM 765 / NCIMB 8382 / VKM B-1628 / Singapore I) TaxID=768706 RepID=G7WFN6_DESOD|nr:hypothetical protein Desor_3414 [Desulfosporosinus orientis DSM 765]
MLITFKPIRKLGWRPTKTLSSHGLNLLAALSSHELAFLAVYNEKLYFLISTRKYALKRLKPDQSVFFDIVILVSNIIGQ